MVAQVGVELGGGVGDHRWMFDLIASVSNFFFSIHSLAFPLFSHAHLSSFFARCSSLEEAQEE